MSFPATYSKDKEAEDYTPSKERDQAGQYQAALGYQETCCCARLPRVLVPQRRPSGNLQKHKPVLLFCQRVMLFRKS